MNPTGLPEPSKPLRDLNFDQKREKIKFQNLKKFKKSKNRHGYSLFSVLLLSGQEFCPLCYYYYYYPALLKPALFTLNSKSS